MLGEVESKLEEFYNDLGNKQLQDEVVAAAVKEMAEICVGGLYVYDENKEYINNMIGQDLINKDTIGHIRELLIENYDVEGYEKYVYKKREDMERIYSYYFNTFTSVLDDGRIYNSILNMYWNDEAGLWQSDGSDGWVRFTLMMPYRTAAAESTDSEKEKKSKYYYVNGESVCSGEINLKDPAQRELLMFSMLCNDSTNQNGQEIGDPTETALINLGSLLGEDYAQVREEYPRLSEVPFDSDRKLMSTEHFIDGRYVMVVKGAVDVLLDRMSHIQDGDTLRKITEEDRVRIEVQNKHFSENGLRVLAFAFKTMEQEQGLTLNDENDLTFLGLISMMDPPRVESKDAVAECIKAGIKPIMITGDHKVTAAAIAKRIGILENMSEACEGAVIEDMTDEELQEFVPNISVYARVSPEHKIRIVRAWQERGNIVAMTGDGVNDAPALKQADIGVAMGITGSEVAKDAAAMVLTDDNFATIVKAVENGRNIYQNIKNAIQFLLSGNFAAILAVLYASLASLPVPFAPVHLLFINLLTDSLPAIALGLEPHNPEVMKEKPRAMGESILTKPFLTSIGVEGLCIGIMTMTAFMIGYRDGNAVLASTMAFGTLCSSRLVHGFNCKANKPIIFTKRFWNNIYLIGAFVLGWLLITGVLMIPALQGMFKVQTLTVAQLMTVYGLALLNLPVIQLLKWIRTRKK